MYKRPIVLWLTGLMFKYTALVRYTKQGSIIQKSYPNHKRESITGEHKFIIFASKPLTTMKLNLLLFLISLFLFAQLKAQLFASAQQQTTFSANQSVHKDKPRAARYSSIGYNIPLGAKDIIIGGTTTVYRKFGTFVSYNVGIQNFMMPTQGDRGEFRYDKVIENGWTVTGNREQSAAFMFNGGMAVAVTKKIPLYFGAGVTRYREFFEYIDPFDGKRKWNVDDSRTRLEVNYSAGTFIPLFSRLVLNVGYNHNPQCVFVGLCISGPNNYRDADDWWWGNESRNPGW